VWVTEGTKPVKVEHILETMFVGDFITDHLTGQHGIVLTADKHLYRESDGNVVVAGKKLKSYVDVDEDGDKTVSFILKAPPITTSAAGTAGAPTAVVPAICGAGNVSCEFCTSELLSRARLLSFTHLCCSCM
jgi:hypothetical protein